MSIPKAREELLALASKYPSHPMAGAIRDIVDERMFRQLPVRKAPRKIARLTPAQAEAIRAEARVRPNASQLELANMFGTNPGRVSEALNHLR